MTEEATGPQYLAGQAPASVPLQPQTRACKTNTVAQRRLAKQPGNRSYGNVVAVAGISARFHAPCCRRYHPLPPENQIKHDY